MWFLKSLQVKPYFLSQLLNGYPVMTIDNKVLMVLAEKILVTFAMTFYKGRFQIRRL